MSITAALVINELTLNRGSVTVLDGVSLSVAPGSITTLMGVSGAGKSTVLRTITALEAFNSGSISVGDFILKPGGPPPESALRALRARVGMVFQQHALFPHLSALENVMLAPIHTGLCTRSEARSTALQLLSSLGVVHRQDAFPAQLSGGEAQRVAIARALALNPTLLLMDEPTAALDPARRSALAFSLRELAGNGRSLLITTHDLGFARSMADSVVILAEGRVVEQGTPDQVLNNPKHAATRSLLADQRPSAQ